MQLPFWSAPIDRVLTETAARPEGLTQIEADRQMARFGRNRGSDARQITTLGLLLNQFRSPLVILLLFAMALSLFLRETTDGLIVLAILPCSASSGDSPEVALAGPLHSRGQAPRRGRTRLR